MNVGGASIVLRERTPLEVLDLSILFCRQRGGLRYVRLLGLFVLPTYVVLLALRYALDVDWTLVWLSAFGLALLLELPFLALAGRLLFDPNASLGPALRMAAGRLPAYLGTGILILGIAGVSVFTIVGPWFVAAVYCFVPEILTLEGMSGFSAMRRAQRFLVGRSGMGAATMLLRFALMLALLLLGEELGQAGLAVLLDVHLEVDQLFEDGGSPFALAGMLLSVPLTATFRFLSYVSERTVQDGWDVQVALLALAGKDEVSSR
jgi:hypothetical protein